MNCFVWTFDYRCGGRGHYAWVTLGEIMDDEKLRYGHLIFRHADMLPLQDPAEMDEDVERDLTPWHERRITEAEAHAMMRKQSVEDQKSAMRQTFHALLKGQVLTK